MPAPAHNFGVGQIWMTRCGLCVTITGVTRSGGYCIEGRTTAVGKHLYHRAVEPAELSWTAAGMFSKHREASDLDLVEEVGD